MAPEKQVKEQKPEDEEVTFILSAVNNNIPQSQVEFSYSDHAFQPVPLVDQTEVVLTTRPTLISADGEEARLQRDRVFDLKRARQGVSVPTAEMDPDAVPQGVILRNKFNFTDRAVQAQPCEETASGMQTVTPVPTVWSGMVTQGVIFDHFAEIQRQKEAEAMEEERNRRARALNKRPTENVDQTSSILHLDEVSQRLGGIIDDDVSPLAIQMAGSEKQQSAAAATTPTPGSGADLAAAGIDLGGLLQSLRYAERIVSSAIHTSVIHDMRFFDDPADEHRTDHSGTVLPLVTLNFSPAVNSGKAVTALAPHPAYPDVLAVGYGAWSLPVTPSPVVSSWLVIYVMSNLESPEYVVPMPADVCSLDWHQTDYSVLSVGLSDGTLAVYKFSDKFSSDGRQRSQIAPIPQEIASTAVGACNLLAVKAAAHRDAVWSVRWGSDRGLASAGADGVSQWILENGDLRLTSHMDLHDPSKTQGMPIGAASLSFNPKTPSVYALGTDSGHTLLCSANATSHYLRVLNAHNGSVLQARWSQVMPRFLYTASEDWTVCLWDYRPAQLQKTESASADNDGDKEPAQETATERPPTEGGNRGQAKRAEANLPTCDTTRFDDQLFADKQTGFFPPLLQIHAKSAVTDLAPSPVIPTAFVAVCEDGCFLACDLSVCAYDFLCCQRITTTARLLRIAYVGPSCVAIGDSAGVVHLLRLSPNLRKASHYVMDALAAPLSPAQQIEADKVMEQQKAMELIQRCYQDASARDGITLEIPTEQAQN